jgi:hypothetical protein
VDSDGNGYFETATSEKAMTRNRQTAANTINNDQTVILYLML